MPFIGITDLFGVVIIAMSETVAVLYVLGAIGLLAVVVPWLATMEQPAPQRTTWALNRVHHRR